MKLVVNVYMNASLFHKLTCEEIEINEEIKTEFDEDSAEYQETCEKYREAIGFERGETRESKDKFDKKVLEFLSQEARETLLLKVSRISEAIKTCYLSGGGKGGFIEFGGYIINPHDFCAIRFKEIVCKFSKR